jgi:hypothetical protein
MRILLRNGSLDQPIIAYLHLSNFYGSLTFPNQQRMSPPLDFVTRIMVAYFSNSDLGVSTAPLRTPQQGR